MRNENKNTLTRREQQCAMLSSSGSSWVRNKVKMEVGDGIEGTRAIETSAVRTSAKEPSSDEPVEVAVIREDGVPSCKRQGSPLSKDTNVDFSEEKKVKREDTVGPTLGVSSSSSIAVVVDVATSTTTVPAVLSGVENRHDGSGGYGEEQERRIDEDEDDSEDFTEDSDTEGLLRARDGLRRILAGRADERASEEDESEEDEYDESDSEDGRSDVFRYRVRLINAAEEGCHFEDMEVSGNHRTMCNNCNTKNFVRGDPYAVDRSCGVYNAPKLCASCVTVRSDVLLALTGNLRQYLACKKMQKQLEKKFFLFYPYINGGLFQKGPNEPFRIRPDEALKTFEQHMETNCPFSLA
jgi:hypothetical protein